MQQRQWLVLNVGLTLIALLLFLNFWGIRLPSVGKVLYDLDPEVPRCLVEWQGQATEWNDLNRCCLEAQAQLGCQQEEKQWTCKTGNNPKNNVQYQLNNKAYRYCQQQVFWR
ncbi:MAG: hypothetical protein AABX13_00175 [Nanoarchaeota archaeon]